MNRVGKNFSSNIMAPLRRLLDYNRTHAVELLPDLRQPLRYRGLGTLPGSRSLRGHLTEDLLILNMYGRIMESISAHRKPPSSG